MVGEIAGLQQLIIIGSSVTKYAILWLKAKKNFLTKLVNMNAEFAA